MSHRDSNLWSITGYIREKVILTLMSQLFLYKNLWCHFCKFYLYAVACNFIVSSSKCFFLSWFSLLRSFFAKKHQSLSLTSTPIYSHICLHGNLFQTETSLFLFFCYILSRFKVCFFLAFGKQVIQNCLHFYPNSKVHRALILLS